MVRHQQLKSKKVRSHGIKTMGSFNYENVIILIALSFFLVIDTKDYFAFLKIRNCPMPH